MKWPFGRGPTTPVRPFKRYQNTKFCSDQPWRKPTYLPGLWHPETWLAKVGFLWTSRKANPRIGDSEGCFPKLLDFWRSMARTWSVDLVEFSRWNIFKTSTLANGSVISNLVFFQTPSMAILVPKGFPIQFLLTVQRQFRHRSGDTQGCTATKEPLWEIPLQALYRRYLWVIIPKNP